MLSIAGAAEALSCKMLDSAGVKIRTFTELGGQ